MRGSARATQRLSNATSLCQRMPKDKFRARQIGVRSELQRIQVETHLYTKSRRQQDPILQRSPKVGRHRSMREMVFEIGAT